MTQPHIPLPGGLSVMFAEPPSGNGRYATSRLQRGLLLFDGETPLAEEAVGFGVPVLKQGLQTIFPGSAQVEQGLDGTTYLLRVRYALNRVERFARGPEEAVGNRIFYAAKDLLAATMRHMPPARRPLTAASSGLRQIFGWKTAYVDAGFDVGVNVDYAIESATGRILIELDCGGLPREITEVVLMHEQGAHVFDSYEDSSGLRLQGDAIGCWDDVRAEEAWFESRTHDVAFKVGAVDGTRLFRGRELIGARLAWAGFGYSFPPSLRRLRHELTLSRSA